MTPFVKWSLIVFAGLFVVSLVLPFGTMLDVVLQFLFFLATGWVMFVWRVLPQIEINPPMVASGIVAAVAAAWLLHRAALRFSGRERWGFGQTAAVMGLVLALFGASVCGAGIVHQAGWLARGPVVENRSKGWLTKETNNIRQLYIGMVIYASEHDSRYPERLEELVDEEIIEPDNYPRLRLSVNRDGGGVEPAAYFGAGLTESDPDHYIVIATARPMFTGNKRAVATNDGAVKTMWEEEFQERLAAQLEELEALGRR